MNSNFVVLTTNRSGSVWVMSSLNSLPGVSAQGELFLPRKRKPEKRWDSDFAIPRYIESKSNGINLRPFSVFSYLNSLYTNPDIVGFKLMYKQLGLYPEIFIYLIQHRIRVVHLVRNNHLDVLVSYAVKKNLGQAHLLEGQSAPENIQVDIETYDLRWQLRRLERKQNLAREILLWSRLSHIEVAYEDLLNDRSKFKTILKFLAIDSVENLPESSTIKIRKGNHREVIRNYDEVKQALASTRYAGLLN